MRNNKIAGLLISIIFVNLLITGAYISNYEYTGNVAYGTVTLIIAPLDDCKITLDETWNFISHCKNATITNIAQALNGSNYQFVLEWDEVNQTYQVFSPLSGNNPFTNFDIEKSYFIYIQNGTTLYLPSGPKFNDTNLSLPSQWNTPFYPFESQGNTTTYLNTLNQDWDFMLLWDYPTQSFKVKSRLSNQPPFETISPGEGQFIYLNQPSLLQYNKTEVIA